MHALIFAPSKRRIHWNCLRSWRLCKKAQDYNFWRHVGWVWGEKKIWPVFSFLTKPPATHNTNEMKQTEMNYSSLFHQLNYVQFFTSTCFFLQEQFYKNNEAQICPKIKNKLRTIEIRPKCIGSYKKKACTTSRQQLAAGGKIGGGGGVPPYKKGSNRLLTKWKNVNKKIIVFKRWTPSAACCWNICLCL